MGEGVKWKGRGSFRVRRAIVLSLAGKWKSKEVKKWKRQGMEGPVLCCRGLVPGDKQDGRDGATAMASIRASNPSALPFLFPPVTWPGKRRKTAEYHGASCLALLDKAS